MHSKDGHAGGDAPPSSFDGFMSEIAGLARTLAPEIGEMLDPDGRVRAAAWSGSRDRGLRLCLSMLRYARAELATEAEVEGLDRAIARVETELLIEQSLADRSGEELAQGADGPAAGRSGVEDA